jgi:hypothetical protein
MLMRNKMVDEKRPAYKVMDFKLGDKQEADMIIFATLADMEQAYKDIDIGRDIYIEKDGVVTKLLHQMVSAKVYDGKIRLSARMGGK